MPENDSNHSQKKGKNDRDVGSFAFEIASDHSADNTLLPPFSNSGRVTSNSDYDGLHKTVPRFNEIFPKDLAAVNSSASHTYIGNISPENSASTHVLEKTGLIDRWASGLTSASHKAYGGFSFDGQSSSNYAQVSPPTTGFGARRSRPSFLDSISISTVSATSPPIETVNTDTFSSKVHPLDNLGSSNSESLMNSSVVSGNGSDMFKYAVAKSMETNHDFYSQKQNEDFAALEQASRALAESLAAENSALTDSYNQQGGVVNQLQADMEALQGEIKANLAELEAVKVEYANVQLECSAADERSKLLASEVIGLEEKALRLRSNELKLERELEKTKS
nr:protein BLISTER-like isoform X2 [Ipomoea batatas]